METIDAYAIVVARYVQGLREKADADHRAAQAKLKAAAAVFHTVAADFHAVVAALEVQTAEHGTDISAVPGVQEALAQLLILEGQVAASVGRAQGPA